MLGRYLSIHSGVRFLMPSLPQRLMSNFPSAPRAEASAPVSSFSSAAISPAPMWQPKRPGGIVTDSCSCDLVMIFAWLIASVAAPTASSISRDMTLVALRCDFGTTAFTSNSSSAICATNGVGKPLKSKVRHGPMLLLPSQSALQSALMPRPKGVTVPVPVITTLRVCRAMDGSVYGDSRLAVRTALQRRRRPLPISAAVASKAVAPGAGTTVTKSDCPPRSPPDSTVVDHD